jgi:glucosamine 6-phosphate synthetase-like amidotransferase/phosphosugar isomerase protein
MCSIFGFIARRDRGPAYTTLREIVTANIQRGPHAFGFAWIDHRGTLHAYRQQGRLSHQLDILSIVSDARILIGHLRYATDGDPDQNINNHPHPCDGGWIAHNGIVHNHRQLIDHHQLNPVSQCDSETIGLLIEQSTRRSRLARTAHSIRQTTGPLAVMGIWSRPSVLFLARRGNPLHYADTGDALYFGSIAQGLPGHARCVADNQVVRVRVSGGQIRTQATPLPAADSQWTRAFDPASYRGG